MNTPIQKQIDSIVREQKRRESRRLRAEYGPEIPSWPWWHPVRWITALAGRVLL